MTMEVYGAFRIKAKAGSVKANGAFLMWHVDKDPPAYCKGSFKWIQIYLKFLTGAGLAPKEVTQAKTKQDTHEAVRATRKPSRECVEKRRKARRITASAIFPLSSLCPISISSENVNPGFFPMRPFALLFTFLILASQRRLLFLPSTQLLPILQLQGGSYRDARCWSADPASANIHSWLLPSARAGWSSTAMLFPGLCTQYELCNSKKQI